MGVCTWFKYIYNVYIIMFKCGVKIYSIQSLLFLDVGGVMFVENVVLCLLNVCVRNTMYTVTILSL